MLRSKQMSISYNHSRRPAARLTAMKIIRVGLIGIVTLAAPHVRAETPAPALRDLAFLTAHAWNATLPDSPEGKKQHIHAEFTWTKNGQGIRVSNQFVTDGKASPYIDGLYAWDPHQRLIVFWYVDAQGGLTRGTVKVEGGQLVHEFQETSADGKTADFVARVTPHGEETWENEIFARTDAGLKSVVKVRYEPAG
jgi:hypothetical protein